MASKVEIANAALNGLGAERITTLDEDSESARKVDTIYESTLKALLRAHFWNFAMKEASLARLSDVPVLSDYTYIFQLPSDFVRLKKTNLDETDNYKVKGKRIYCNSTTLKIEYVYFCDDPNEYDAAFIDALSARLAAELCYSITANASLTELKWAEFKEKFQKAKSVDSQEETPDKPKQGSWIRGR